MKTATKKRRMIPYSTQEVTKKDIKAVRKALKSSWIAGGGNYTQKLEDKLCEYTGYKYAVLVNSGTAGLHLAYLALNQSAIVISNLTFIATYSMGIRAWKNVTVANPENDLVHLPFNDTKDVAIVETSYAGYPVFDRVLADDCHYLYPQMGKIRNVETSVVSFHPVKHITTGEGGAILTNDLAVYIQCKHLRSHGRDADGGFSAIGYNYRLPDINAALGLSQMDRLDENLSKRVNIASVYRNHWVSDERIIMPPYNKYHAYHLFPITLKNIDRQRFMLEMANQDIMTQIHYKPVSTQRVYRGTPVPYPEKWDRMVSIPLFSSMTEKEMKKVMDAVDKSLDKLYE